MRETEQSALTWRKSSRSGVRENCVEVAFTATAVAVRDSKDPNGPTLRVTPRAFQKLLRALR
ncbi:DUF397 domain-containing protein [Saccharopolyspora erythraea]|uniref:DUF397 domain-containing protein n=1 Tax=Saccharopolyspora erythraea TaxID=1836 RepID=UPI001BA99835|nr:DUF397 domain-containing protein [Saccharopolyspora erythraea]QUH02838.1 DUF397 domain-containing protein [Saccharopolyspora erythraea]